MEIITEDTVLAAHNKKPKRRCFANDSGIQKNKSRPTFSVYMKSAKKIFEAQTGQFLNYNPQYDNYWKYVSEEEIVQIEEWERKQHSLVYLRDCLSLSIAVDVNLTDNTSGQYTGIGRLEHNGKNDKDMEAVKEIADITSDVIQSLPYYKDADLICSVPPDHANFNLPKCVTSLVSGKINKQDVTGGFIFGEEKSSVKNSSVDKKWDVWESAQVSFQNTSELNVKDKTVILIDDKYQSGITIQYIAMKLQQAGACEVYGFSFVKTLSDTDNTDE